MSEAQPRKLKYGERATLRDKKGRPLYLAKLPFYKKYPRLFMHIGGIIGFFSVTGAFIYKAFIRDNSDVTYEDTLWPSERARGKSNRQRYLEKYHPEKYAEEMAEIEARKKALNQARERSAIADAPATA